MKKLLFPAAFLMSVFSALSARAADLGIAKDWELGFQPPATPVMEKLNDIHNFLLVIISVITALVLLVLIYVCLRYNRRMNPVPSKTTHNTRLEVIWTAIPIIILVVIAIPSLRLHYYMQRDIDPGLTVKVTGYQWYWHYDYPDNGGFGYDSYLKKDDELKPGDHRQLTVDHAMVVPVNTKVRVLITGADVIHSWSVPSFGVKRDAIPGRLNNTWFEADHIGTYYGQCSQLCGVGHGFMPIEVNVVSKEDFDSWVKKQQDKAGIKSTAAKPEEKPETRPEAVKAEAPKAVAHKPEAAPAAAPAEEKPEPKLAPPAPQEKPVVKKEKPAPKKAVRKRQRVRNMDENTDEGDRPQDESDDNDVPEPQYKDFKIGR